MRLWLCALTLWSGVALVGAQDESIHHAPIRRIIIYKDGHCFTERALNLEDPTTSLFLADLPNAVAGTVWASTERGGTVKNLQARWLDWTRSIPVQNLAELLVLNDGKPVEVEISVAGSDRQASLRTYSGVLRVFKPELRYQDAHPTADAPPRFTPVKSEEPDTHMWGYYRPPTPEPTDFAQDEWSRTAEKATFAVEGEQGLLLFKPEQVVRLQFHESPQRKRPLTTRRPVLELSLDGARRGTEVKLYAVERGVRWTPEYQLLLPEGDAREATLTLNAVVLNELDDMQGVQAAVVVGAPQFMLEQVPSPMNLRDTFRKLSRWFQDELSRAMGGNVAFSLPSAPSPEGLGDSSARSRSAEQAAPPNAHEPITLLTLPPLNAPKGTATRVEIARQKVSAERACVWVRDIDLRELPRWYAPYWASPQYASFLTLEDIAYRTAQARRFRDEVHEAYILRNTGTTPWTTGSALILKEGAPQGQDILFRTEPGDEAYLITGPAHGIGIVVSGYEPNLHLMRTAADSERPKQRVVVRVQNQRKEPTRVIVRIRFLGEFLDATRSPTRVVTKTHTFQDWSWDWYYLTEARNNPRTELVWDFIAVSYTHL
ncbi:MAG: hypothetical protein N2651_10280, partial [Fimbriimonadales bacterium]|nr:hypothetical protein [Fimbriimonadales bacterium]